MDRYQLDSFLRQNSLLEKLFLANKDISTFPLADFGESLTGERHVWRYMPYRDITMAEFYELLRRFQGSVQFNDRDLPPGEKISFILNPRFYKVMNHSHSYIEMIYVYSGTCRQTINNKQVTMQEGDICILDTNAMHSIEPASENDIIVNCLMKKSYFDSAMLSRLSGNDILSSFFIHAIYQSKDYNSYILFQSHKNSVIQESMANVLCEYINKKTCSDMVIDSYMIIIFSELLRIHGDDVNVQNFAAFNETKLSDILQYLQENYKKATLESTAQYFHFNMSYLSSTIKKLTGRRFIDLIQEIKLKRACELLESSDIPIGTIANEIGYYNINFFYQLFKKYYGITPSEYRKKGSHRW